MALLDRSQTTDAKHGTVTLAKLVGERQRSPSISSGLDCAIVV
ncbi:hypothetical protein CKA32_002704 [Geitlerinema sp. FC II]|nr:hypothetical protein [Geitlerinema sp. CS-897]PPT06158.1 hypothetical protein CKA32_002704 [Geitlerinema sp. FC II]